MIELTQLINNPVLLALAALLMGIIINFDICPLAGDFAILSYIVQESKGFKKTLPHILLYTLGRIVAYSALTAIIFFGFSQFNFSFITEKGELLIGIALIIFGLANLRIEEHCHEHDSPESKKVVANKSMLGSFLWGFLFSLGFCPHSAAMFFGVFVPIATTPPLNPWLPIMFALGASSVIIFFSILLSINPVKGRNLLEKIEQKEKTTKLLVAIIFILIGLLYLVK